MRADKGKAARPSAWRRVVGDALRFDRSGVVVADALRMTIGTTLPLMIGVAAGSWSSGAAAAGGALAVGIGSVIPSSRARISGLAATAVGMAIGTFVGSATSGYPTAHVVVGAVVAFGCGLLLAVETTYAGAGINTLVAFLVYGRFSAPPLIAARTAGFVAAGAFLQVVLVLLLRRRPRVGRALTGLAGAYDSLADFASGLDVDRSSLQVAQAIDAATTDLEFSFRAGGARDALASLAGEARRVRIELLGLATARSIAVSSDADRSPILVRLGAAASTYLRCVARSLATAQVLPDCDDALDDVEGVIAELDESSDATFRITSSSDGLGNAFVRATASARALAGQLRAIGTLVPDAVGVQAAGRVGVGVGIAAMRSASRVSKRGVHGLELVAQRMRANLTPESDAFRHAIRLAAVVTVATAIAHTVDLGRGYWLALTAVLVLRPEFSITFTRGVARAVGTILGVGIATTVAVITHPHGWILVVFVACFVWLSGALFNASYAVFSVAITGVVVFLLAGLDPDPVTTGGDRLLATVLGAALALIAYAAFPTWGRRPAAVAVADLANTTHRYVVAILRSYLGAGVDPSTLPGLSRAVRLSRTNSESALDRSFADPGFRQVDPRTNVEILAALRRLAIAAHTLRLRRPAGPTHWQPSVQRELTQLVDALDVELNGIAARLRFGRIAYHHEELRAFHRAAVTAVSSATSTGIAVDETTALVVAETDEMVDAVNTLNAVLDHASTAIFIPA